MRVTQAFDPSPAYLLRARAADTLQVVAHISEFTAARWQHHLYHLGDFNVALYFDDTLLDWAQNEGVLEIVRNGVTEFVGLVDDFEVDEETGFGHVSGPDARVMLAWRTIIPAAGSESDDQLGVSASNAIRHYVQNNLSAPSDGSRDIDSEFSGGVTFTVAAGSVGSVVSRQERYSDLLTTAMQIARQGDIHFGVTLIAGPDYQLVFDTFTNKTAGQSGAVVLSAALGTVFSLRTTVNRGDYANAALVLGERVDAAQTVYVDTDPDNGSQFRRERVLTAGGATTKATLTLRDVTQFWTDWSDEPVQSGSGVNAPAAWSERWDSAVLFDIRSTGLPAGTSGGVALSISERRIASGAGRCVISPDFLGILDEDVEIVARLRYAHSSVQENFAVLALHGGGAGDTSEDGYITALHGGPSPSTVEWSTNRLAAGTPLALIENEAFNINTNTWYRARMGHSGKTVRAVVGADNASSTDSWFEEIKDSAFDEGWIGIGRFSVGGGFPGTTWCDWIGIGLNGERAPQSMPDQTVTIGSVTYTFSGDMSVARNVMRARDAETLAANLAAAINASGGAGTLYGTGTTAHPDVTAVADGRKVTVLAKGSGASNIALDAELHNGEWDLPELNLSVLAGVAAKELEEGAHRVRSYEAVINPRSLPYRTRIELGDLVSVRSERLGFTDSKLVNMVGVSLDPTRGEVVTLRLGETPRSLHDEIEEQRQDIRALKTRR